MKRPPVFFNGVELTTPEQIEQALRHYSRESQSLLELRQELERNDGRLPEDDGPDPIWKAIARASSRRRVLGLEK